MERYDVIILGAGAAGMFCAIEAARRGRRVVVLDHAAAPGEKIRISGGGRCNFTNLNIRPERFLSRNPRFALSALRRYSAQDFIARVDRAGISWHEKTLGQLFCDGSAKEIVAMLTQDMAEAGVTLRLRTEIAAVRQSAGHYVVDSSAGIFTSESLVVACGGKSIPKMGASDLGYRLAQQFGLGLVETRPGLVPLTFGGPALAQMQEMAGLSVAAQVGLGKTHFQEGLLFTHRGLSGPSVLQISSYWREGDRLSINLAAGQDIAASLIAQKSAAGRISLKNALAQFLPEKLARLLADQSGLVGNLADQSNAKLTQLGALVQAWPVTPTGSEGYRTAEVTLGGVDTDALDSRTLAAKSQPGLFFIGEVVDVTGWLGGYNFQWAWSSGWAAGQVA